MKVASSSGAEYQNEFLHPTAPVWLEGAHQLNQEVSYLFCWFGTTTQLHITYVQF